MVYLRLIVNNYFVIYAVFRCHQDLNIIFIDWEVSFLKKWIASLLLLIVLFCNTGCGNKPAGKTEGKDDNNTVAETMPLNPNISLPRPFQTVMPLPSCPVHKQMRPTFLPNTAVLA